MDTFPQPAAVELVDVSFVTVPYYYEAKICVDGELLTQGDGTPYTTPCTVEGLAAGPHRVEFERNGQRWNADPRDAAFDFARTRQIVSKLPK